MPAASTIPGRCSEGTELFIDSIFRSDRSVVDLLTADHTYLNEELALLYGMQDVKGGEFRRVTLTDPKRFGLLGKGAVLMTTANPDRTAPVLRGAWIMERILGTPQTTPPPNVPTLIATVAGKPTTVRERTEVHRRNPPCAGCHAVMDPLGFALENFDTVGQFRAIDPQSHTLIDTAATLAGWHAHGRPRGPAQGAGRARAAAGPGDHRKADDLCGRSPDGLSRHAERARASCAQAASQNYRFEVHCPGRRAKRCVPQARTGRAAARVADDAGVQSEFRTVKKAGGIAMFLTKKHLSRRTVLKGAGATIALPLLDAMIPARTALGEHRRSDQARASAMCTSRTARCRSSGRRMGAGKDFKFSPILKPLEGMRDYVTVVTNLRNKPAREHRSARHHRGDLAHLHGAEQPRARPAMPASPSTRWPRARSARTRRCPRIELCGEPGGSSTTAAPVRDCRWKAIRATCSRPCSAPAIRMPSARACCNPPGSLLDYVQESSKSLDPHAR